MISRMPGHIFDAISANMAAAIKAKYLRKQAKSKAN